MVIPPGCAAHVDDREDDVGVGTSTVHLRDFTPPDHEGMCK